MEDVLRELKELIDHVQLSYTEMTNEWSRRGKATINLKKSLVADIDVDGTICKNIMEYVQLLNEHNDEIILSLLNMHPYRVAARVKTQNSIEYKIQSYKTNRHEYGKVPISKCINDLFGVRISLRVPLTFEEIYAFIEGTYQGRYKCINSSKAGYKAVHIYFRRNNYSFPWELQIWNECDAENNLISHESYKQEYVTWEGRKQ